MYMNIYIYTYIYIHILIVINICIHIRHRLKRNTIYTCTYRRSIFIHKKNPTVWDPSAGAAPWGWTRPRTTRPASHRSRRGPWMPSDGRETCHVKFMENPWYTDILWILIINVRCKCWSVYLLLQYFLPCPVSLLIFILLTNVYSYLLICSSICCFWLLHICFFFFYTNTFLYDKCT